MKNWSGTLIKTATELAASSFFAREEIISPSPIAEIAPKKIDNTIAGIFQERLTWKRSRPLASMMAADK